MPSSFRTERRVQFADTDMAGLVHFPRFFYYMEEAEHAFLRSLGTDVVVPQPDGSHLSWPRVSTQCDYKAPARYGDVLDIEIRIARKGRSSVTYQFLFTLGEQTIAVGSITAVCCLIPPGQKPKAMPLPEPLASQLEVHPDLVEPPATTN